MLRQVCERWVQDLPAIGQILNHRDFGKNQEKVARELLSRGIIKKRRVFRKAA